ncbi:hypothetical protein SRHO_G00234520 [Serrasalmus rhombeus]
MEFPVDALVSVSHEELERSAHSYMSELLYSDPEHGQYFTLTTGRKIRISLSNVGFVPLYGANLKHKVLALFAPEDQFTAVALFLDDQWCAVDDILRTADPAREGLIEVRSVAERIVLYVLNRIVYRTNEMSAGEVPFLCHGENDYAKILWKSGKAVGFYSVKPRGSLCNNFVSQCYLLPVMDSIFVRKSHRGNEHGLQMLEDYVDSFKDDELGLKYPLSPAMSRVCRHYLDRYPADVDLLWEVEGVGGPYQKTRVASKLSSHALRGGLLSWGKDDGKNGQTVEDKVEMTEETSLDITEEIIVVNRHLKVAEETHDTPISTRTRSSEHKRKKRMREEKEMSAAESQPEKVCRVEEQETEAVVQEAEGEKSGQEVAESAPEPADETEEQAAPEASTVEQEPKEQVMEVNGELTEEPGAEHNKEEVQGSIAAEAVLQNGTVGEEEEEMDVDEAAEKQDPIDTVDSLEEAAVEEPKEVDEENLEGEVDTVAIERQEEDSSVAEEQEVSPAAEEEGLAEDKLPEEAPQAAGAEEKEEKEVALSAEVACEAEEKQKVPPNAEEKREVPPDAEEKQEIAPDSEEKREVAPDAEEKREVAPDAEEKREAAPDAEEKREVAPDAEEKREAAPDAEEKREAAPDAEEKREAAPDAEEKREVAPDAEEKREAAPDAEEKREAAPDAEEKREAAPDAEEKREVAPDAEEKREAAPDAEEKLAAAPDAEEKLAAPLEAEEKLAAPLEAEEKLAAPPEGEERLAAPPEGEERLAGTS